MFNEDGYVIPVFAGANLLDSTDGIVRYSGDDRMAIVHIIPTDAGNDRTAQVLHVVPLTREQTPVLSVIVGPPIEGFEETCRGFTWSWHARDLDADGVPEIEIGPNVSERGDITPRAVYRWPRVDHQYAGPEGSPRDGFLRIDRLPRDRPSTTDPCRCTAARDFANARALLNIPTDRALVRRRGSSGCIGSSLD